MQDWTGVRAGICFLLCGFDCELADDSDHIHLIPRSQPAYNLEHGILELNALGYAGMLLVRSEEEGKALDAAAEKLPKGLSSILAHCAIDRKYGEEALTADATQHGGAGALFDGL